MDRPIASTLTCAFRLSLPVVAGAVLLVVAGGVSSGAQTLSDPYPRTTASPSATKTKSTPDKHAKACKAYGAGFVQIAGTDTCVKVGGYVTIESGR